MPEQNQPSTDSQAPATTAAPPTVTDKVAPFRPLFGMPVAVQFAMQTPYVQIAPRTDPKGNVTAVRVPETGQIIGHPAVADQEKATGVAIGVLHPSEDGTWLVIEQQIGIQRSDEECSRLGIVVRSPADKLKGHALMDVYVRPEMVTHISFVKAVEMYPTPARES